MGPFRLNPGPFLEKMAQQSHNPPLPLAHVRSSNEVRDMVHETIEEYQDDFVEGEGFVESASLDLEAG
jgi:hypothetical protein